MMRRSKAGSFLFVLISLFALSCSQQNSDQPHGKALYFAPGQLEAHYLKHAYQFGDISQEDYLEDARALLNAAAGNDVLEKVRPNGDVLRYRVKTGEFAVMTKEGVIRTYFKTNYQYWMRQ